MEIDFKEYLALRELEELETKTALHNMKYGKTMKEENKFYTPELEEFCKGFEYEQLGPKNEWVKSTWDFHKFSEGRFLSLLHTPAWIRVKLLDKEDFEEVLDRKQLKGDGVKLNFQLLLDDSDDFYEFDYDTETKLLTVEFLKEVEENGHSSYTVFKGKIKNKSELKRLLTLLEIL